VKKVIAFFGEVKDELAQVTWPTRAEVTRLTLVVIAISVIVAVYVGGLDFLFTKVLGLVIVR
jgi:preprotein translocase subunit SecE